MAQEYSYNDLVKMQEQAIRRVRDMQERARLTMQEHNREETENQQPNTQTSLPEKVTPPEKAEQKQEVPPKQDKRRENRNDRDNHTRLQSNPFGNLLNLDKDKAIILPLLLLLGKENSDNVLLLALMYIMS